MLEPSLEHLRRARALVQGLGELEAVLLVRVPWEVPVQAHALASPGPEQARVPGLAAEPLLSPRGQVLPARLPWEVRAGREQVHALPARAGPERELELAEAREAALALVEEHNAHDCVRGRNHIRGRLSNNYFHVHVHGHMFGRFHCQENNCAHGRLLNNYLRVRGRMLGRFRSGNRIHGPFRSNNSHSLSYSNNLLRVRNHRFHYQDHHDYRSLPNHWSSRRKGHRDYHYLLPSRRKDLQNQMNQIHHKKIPSHHRYHLRSYRSERMPD